MAYLSCSSGTTGNPAMLMSTEGDVAFTAQDSIKAALWTTKMKPVRDHRVVSLAMITKTPRGV